MNPDKPVDARNVPTPTPPDLGRGQLPKEEVDRRAAELRRSGNASDDASARLEAESRLKAESESKPVAGTVSRPYVDEPGKQLRSRTKVQDPSESAVQPRSATENQVERRPGKPERLREDQ